MTEPRLKPRYDFRLWSRGAPPTPQPGWAAVHREDLLTPQGLTQFPPAAKGHMSQFWEGEGSAGGVSRRRVKLEDVTVNTYSDGVVGGEGGANNINNRLIL